MSNYYKSMHHALLPTLSYTTCIFSQIHLLYSSTDRTMTVAATLMTEQEFAGAAAGAGGGGGAEEEPCSSQAV